MHLHLADQVTMFGPLNKISCFPFENMFQVTRDLFHGTTNFDGQIVRNLEIRKEIIKEIKSLKKSSFNAELKEFIQEFILKSFIKKPDALIKPIKRFKSQLREFESALLNHLVGGEVLYQGQRANFNYTGNNYSDMNEFFFYYYS